MKNAARAAQQLGVGVVNGFTGSSIWHAAVFVSAGARFDDRRRATSSSPSGGIRSSMCSANAACGSRSKCIRRRSRSTSTRRKRALEAIGNREEFGFNFDPSHLLWQGVDPVEFIREFPDRIYHVHIKDAIVTLNGRTRHSGQPSQLRRSAPRLGLPLAGPRRRELRRDHPGAESGEVRRAAVGRVGRRRHGPRARGPRGVRVRARSSTSSRAAWRSTRRLRRGDRTRFARLIRSIVARYTGRTDSMTESREAIYHATIADIRQGMSDYAAGHGELLSAAMADVRLRAEFGIVTYRVTILPRAERQLLEQAGWWAKNRSAEQALRWLDGFELSLAALAHESWSVVQWLERAKRSRFVIRELHYGLRAIADSPCGFRSTKR